MEPLEFLLCLAVVAWVIEGMAVRIGIVGAQPQVDADRPARRLMLDACARPRLRTGSSSRPLGEGGARA